MSNIILCGLPGVGKTTVGRQLAQTLGRPFLDTDQLLEQLYGMTCRELFQREGEAAFRSYEKRVIEALLEKQRHVISLGGGPLEEVSNHAVIMQLGTVIHLKRDWEVLIQRKVENDSPATLQGENKREAFEEIMKRRLPLLEKVQTFSVDITSLSIEKTVELLSRSLKAHSVDGMIAARELS